MPEGDARLSRCQAAANQASSMAGVLRVRTEGLAAGSRASIDRSYRLLQRSYYPFSYAEAPLPAEE